MRKNSNFVEHVEIQPTINQIMNKEISIFFLCDMEVLEDYEKLVKDDNLAAEGIKSAIEDILGVPAIVAVREALKSVSSEAYAEIKKNSDSSKESTKIQNEITLEEEKFRKAKSELAKAISRHKEKEKEKAKEAEKKKKDEAQKKADVAAKAKEDAKKAAAEEKRAAALRNENLKRMQGMAGASGDENAKGTAVKSSGPSASYAGRISKIIRDNITFPPDQLSTNPETRVLVTTNSDGLILTRRIIQSSGVKAWDDAVIRALEKTVRLPKDENGRMPDDGFNIAFRPKDN